MSASPLSKLLISLESGARPKGGVTSESGDIPSLGGEHLDDTGGFRFESMKRIPRTFFGRLVHGKIIQDDILIVKDGATTGKTSFVGNSFPFREAAVNEHLFRLHVDQLRANPKYLFYFLRSPSGQQQILSDFRGGTVGGIGRTFVDRVQVPLPPLKEQRRIADILDQIDLLRSKRQQGHERLDDLIASMFVKMFGNPITNPRGWPRGNLASIASIERGKFTPRPRNDPRYYDGEYPFIQTGDISNSGGRLSTWSQTLNEAGKKVSRSFPPGTVVIAIVGATLGATSILEIEAFCPDSVIGIQVDLERGTPEYVERVLRYWRPVFVAQAPDTARANMNLETLRPLLIPIAPVDLQHAFSTCVGEIEKLKTSFRQHYAKLDELFISFQHRAFGGQLRPGISVDKSIELEMAG